MRPGLGIQRRLGLALVLASVATLAAAGLTVVPPLSHRLVADRLNDLRGLGRTALPALHAVPRTDQRRGSPELLALAGRLERRTGGRILVLDGAGAALADTAQHAGALPAGVEAAARRAAARRPGEIVTGRVGEAVYAAATLRAHGRPLTLVLLRRLGDTRAADAVVRAALPGALAVGLGVALALGAVVSRGLARRLRRLHADAVALGTRGLRHPVHVAGHDEVGEVAAALEALRVRLLEEEATRQAFVATASHELRTPLASLQATLELLAEELGAERAAAGGAAARVDTALRQTHRLAALTTDLLDLSRVDAEAPVHLAPLELAEHARLVAGEFGDRLAADGRAIDVVGGPALVVADATAVVRILRIMVDNATRHGAGRITVRIDPAQGGPVPLTVTDEGAGLGPDERDAVFVRFARGRHSGAGGDRPGFGLGLAIARGLARAMGGDLDAPAAERGGAFRLRLPAWRGEPVAGDAHERRTPA